MKKIFLILVLICIALVAGGAWWSKKGGSGHSQEAAQQQMQMPAVEVSVVTVSPEAITISKDLPGRTSAFRIAEIRPQVTGIITKRLFEEGSEVKEGQQLYQIDPAPYQAAYNSARADQMKAEANVKSVQAKAARYAELVKIGGVSQQDYDDVKAGFDQSKADVAIAAAALAAAKINLDYTKVFSPISGRIGKSMVTEGALVTANQAGALATVQQFDQIYVDVTQSSSELMQLKRQFESAPADMEKPLARLLLDGKTVYEVPGEFQFSEAAVDQGTGMVQLRILFPNPSREILPGLFVHARLDQSKDAAAILIPQQALSRNADGSTTVWVVGEGDKATIRPVKVSHTVGDRWLVDEGLQAGDRVIIEGTMKIQPGAVVKPVERNQAVMTPPPGVQPGTPEVQPAEK